MTTKIDSIKTFCNGALGAMSFGAYHQFTTNKIMELNNQVQRNEMKFQNEKHENDMKKLNDKICELERRPFFW